MSRTRPQRHQNARAFRNDKYDTSARRKVGGGAAPGTGPLPRLPSRQSAGPGRAAQLAARCARRGRAGGEMRRRRGRPLLRRGAVGRQTGGRGSVPTALIGASAACWVTCEAVACPCTVFCRKVLKSFSTANEAIQQRKARNHFSGGETFGPGLSERFTAVLRE